MRVFVSVRFAPVRRKVRQARGLLARSQDHGNKETSLDVGVKGPRVISWRSNGMG